MATFVNSADLLQILTSVKAGIATDIAAATLAVFRTDPSWDVTTKANLPSNFTNADNFKVYYVEDEDAQYYWDSGSWISFGPNLTDYYTKTQVDTAVNGRIPLGNIKNYTDTQVTNGVLSQAGGIALKGLIDSLQTQVDNLSGGGAVTIGSTLGTIMVDNSNPATPKIDIAPGITGASGLVLRRNAENTANEWAGLSVPVGGTGGQILQATGATSIGWRAAPNEVPSGGGTGGLLYATDNTTGESWTAVGTSGQILKSRGVTTGGPTWADSQEVVAGGTSGQILSRTGTTGQTWINLPDGVPNGLTGGVLFATNGTTGESWTVGTAGQLLFSRGATASGPSWSGAGTAGQMMVSRGATTNGPVWMPAGTSGQFLKSQGTAATGHTWEDLTGIGSTGVSAILTSAGF